ncbi:MAG TPA: 30S ribosomal protein S9 [Cytophagales bacterium]|jgi:small subunit ribosomal protein S9|nr:30S ribosomal protein S9 [Cytophagales bacterium]
MSITNTIGRRKTSIARIYLKLGKGEITVNQKPLVEYFPSEILRIIIAQPLETLSENGKYDINVNVKGGGTTGQAEAIRLAISRALVENNSEVKPALKKEGFLTRDPRMVERKKPGRKKARRRFQFSKR